VNIHSLLILQMDRRRSAKDNGRECGKRLCQEKVNRNCVRFESKPASPPERNTKLRVRDELNGVPIKSHRYPNITEHDAPALQYTAKAYLMRRRNST
jgi:hypothetical protein